MTKIAHLILSLFILTSIFYSQSLIDSINYKLNSFNSESEKVNFLNNTSNQLRKSFRIKDAYVASEIAVKLVEENKLEELGSKTYSYLGLIYRDQSKFTEAKEAFLKAMEFAIKFNQKDQIAYGYNNIATIERILSNYTEAIELIYKSLEAFKEIDHKKGEGNCYVNLGILYRYQKKYDISIEYLNKAVDIRKEQEDNHGIAQVFYLIAETLYMKGDYRAAISYYLQSAELYQKTDMDKEYSEATIFMGLGGAYYELGEYNTALDYRLKSLKVINKGGDINAKARVNLALGKIYSKLKNYEEAEIYLNKALRYADKANLNSRKLDCYKALAELYKDWKNYDKGFANLNNYVILKDSIYTSESKEQITRIESLYKAEEKEKENELLNAQLQIESQKTLLLTVSFLTAIILLVLLYSVYLHTRKSNKLLREVNRAKDLYFSIISHDIKNPFGTIINSSELLIDSDCSLNPIEKRDLIKNIHESSKKVYELLENLLKWSQNQRGKLTIQKERLNLYEIINNSISLLNETARKKDIEIVNNVDNSLFVEADENTVNSIVRNLINNAIKYSFENKKVIVNAIKKNDKIEVEIIDNGIGINNLQLKNLFKEETNTSTTGTAGERGSGLGLILCKDFVEKNGGELSVSSKEGKGSIFKFTLYSSN